VIPDTLLGLLLFIGSIGPGYVWVRVAEVRRPQQQRTAILEAAELAFVGLLCTATAAIAVLTVAREWKWLGVDLDAFASDGGAYLIAEPTRGIGVILAILVLSFALALAAARVWHREAATILPGYSVWDRLFRLDDDKVAIYAAVELRDGRRFAGYVYAWDVGAGEDDRELALHAPITVQRAGEGAVALDPRFHFLSLRRDDVVWLSVAQTPSPFEDKV
jgi:hypothetical protein